MYIYIYLYIYIFIYIYIIYIYIYIYIPVIHLYPELWSIEIRIDFGILLYVFHLVLLLAAGRLFQLQQAELLVASSANIGGPATASAFVDVPKHGEFMVKTMEKPWKTRGKTRKTMNKIPVSRDFGWIEFGKQKVRTCLVYVDVC